jgi:hypothetical protein
MRVIKEGNPTMIEDSCGIEELGRWSDACGRIQTNSAVENMYQVAEDDRTQQGLQIRVNWARIRTAPC